VKLGVLLNSGSKFIILFRADLYFVGDEITNENIKKRIETKKKKAYFLFFVSIITSKFNLEMGLNSELI
jgi:hypothetical protein